MLFNVTNPMFLVCHAFHMIASATLQSPMMKLLCSVVGLKGSLVCFTFVPLFFLSTMCFRVLLFVLFSVFHFDRFSLFPLLRRCVCASLC